MSEFVPDNFDVPTTLITKKFLLRTLTANDAAKDYEAVITSLDHLKGIFGPNSIWPVVDLTLEENITSIDLHQKEFQKRSLFTYTVMNLGESRCLGCVYILPSDNEQYEAMVIMWVRKSELASGLDEELFSAVQDWIDKKWPFKKVAYPGRKITWDKFLND